MRNETEERTSAPTENVEIGLNRSISKLDSTLEGLVGVEKRMLPDVEVSIVDSILSESLRLAAADFRPVGTGWQVMSVHYLKSWAFSKIKGVLSGDENVVDQAIMNALNGERGPNMVFLGDFISLPRGYYSAAPTRAIPICRETYALTSGMPNWAFRKLNLNVRVNGLGRWIVDVDSEDLLAKNINIQSRDNYIGRSAPIYDPETFMTYLVSHGTRSDWTMSRGSEAYLGPVPGRYDFTWGASTSGVDTAVGRVKIVRLPLEFGGYDYFLRVDDSSGTHRIQLNRKDVRRALLAYDALARSPRTAIIAERDSSVVLELDFPPPFSETRWMCALGAAWLGSLGFRIRFGFSGMLKAQVEELARDMWLKPDFRRR
jgi:hypothetical protein